MIRWIAIAGRYAFDVCAVALGWLAFVMGWGILGQFLGYAPPPEWVIWTLPVFCMLAVIARTMANCSSRAKEHLDVVEERWEARLDSQALRRRVMWVGIATVASVLAMVAFGVLYEPPTPGIRFVVKEGLAEATVYIDGARIGTTPVELDGREVERHMERYAILEGWPPPQALLRHSRTTGGTVEEVATYEPFYLGDAPDSVWYRRRASPTGSEVVALTYRVESPGGRVMKRWRGSGSAGTRPDGVIVLTFR